MEKKSKKIAKNTKKQLEGSEKKVMQRKDKERSEAVKTLMIASYREKYDKESLDIMRQIIDQEKPDNIIILKLLEEKHSTESVDANIGMESKKKLIDSAMEEKKDQVNKFAEGLVKLAEELDIPSQVHLRKGKNLANKIIEEFKKRDVDHLILHKSKKGPLGKIIEGSISEIVKRNLDTKKITQLE